MSYNIDEKQELSTPINEILNGIEKFNERVNERIKSNDWQSNHILKLHRIRTELLSIQIDLEELKHDTW